MKVEESLHAMNLIENLFDGSLWSVYKMARLIDTLLFGNPDDFYAEYLEVLSLDDPLRRQAERLIQSGRVSETTTMHELAAIQVEQE